MCGCECYGFVVDGVEFWDVVGFDLFFDVWGLKFVWVMFDVVDGIEVVGCDVDVYVVVEFVWWGYVEIVDMDVCEVEFGWLFGVVNSIYDGKDGLEYEKCIFYIVCFFVDGIC